MMNDLHGVCPIVATPFTSSAELDIDSLQNLAGWLIDGGCHALTLFGIAGEYYKLSDDERRRVVRVVVDLCRARGVPCIISVTQHATALAVREARTWEDAGADCLMLLPPFFLRPSAADLYRHARAVAAAVRLPIMLQYAPEQTGVPVPPELLAQLHAESPNVSMFKIECRPPGAYISKFRNLAPTARVFIGNAGFQLIEAMERCAVGVMPGCSMFDIYLQIYDAFVSGRRAEAVRIHSRLLPLLNHIRQDVEMIIFYEKKILHRRNVIATDCCRLPTFTPDEIHEKLFEQYYAALRESQAV